MHETGKKLLETMFRAGETICLSPNQYGFHSIPLSEALQDKLITLVPTQDSCIKRRIEWKEENFDSAHTDDLLLVALNPIKGWRVDSNCTAYRNFLVELDTYGIKEQAAYIQHLGMPYSAAIFSGNKSLHFLISLDRDMSSEKVYRMFSEWILNIVTLADQNTKNPSRSIRIPGAIRDTGKRQELIEYRGPVKIEELLTWLKLHPNEKPKEKQERTISGDADLSRVKRWVQKELYIGISAPNRNQKWFTVAVEMALAGYSFDDTIEKLGNFFSEDSDFKEKEWETTIKSGFKYAYDKKV